MTTTGVAEEEEVASFLETVIIEVALEAEVVAFFLETVIEEAQMEVILTEAPEDTATRCATTTVHSQSHTS